jgi:hypothetical protein
MKKMLPMLLGILFSGSVQMVLADKAEPTTTMTTKWSLLRSTTVMSPKKSPLAS